MPPLKHLISRCALHTVALCFVLPLTTWAAFTINTDGTVTDSDTGLVWDRCSLGQSGAACASGAAGTFTWAQALTEVSARNASNYLNFNDWRIPNVKELESLVDITAVAKPLISATFPNTPVSYFWTGTTNASNPARAWTITFDGGTNGSDFKSVSLYVRLVRGGQSFDALAPIDGACGTANGTASLAAPSGAALCSGGNATAVTSNVGTFTWGCNGTNGGASTAANACSARRQFTVTASAGTNGTLLCGTPGASSVIVTHGATARCTATPASGYRTASISGCGGSATATGVNDYTTGAVTAACTVTANFEPIPAGNASQGGSPFTGTTVPGTGRTGGSGSASFTSSTGGPNCAFDTANTAFIAAPVGASVPGTSFPQGMFKFKLVGCTAGFSARMTVTWPTAVNGTYLKYGRSSAASSALGLYTPRGLSINGNSVSFDVTDGQLGDDDWTANGEIVDPTGPAEVQQLPIPTLERGVQAALVLVLALLAGFALRRPRRLR